MYNNPIARAEKSAMPTMINIGLVHATGAFAGVIPSVAPCGSSTYFL